MTFSRRAMLAAVLLTAGVGACSTSGPDTEFPTDAPYIEGTVTRVAQDAVLVEENPSETSGSAKAMLRITPATGIFWRSGESADALDLQLGTRVRVWVTGPIMESYPEQGTARAVVIISVDLPVQHPA